MQAHLSLSASVLAWPLPVCASPSSQDFCLITSAKTLFLDTGTSFPGPGARTSAEPTTALGAWVLARGQLPSRSREPLLRLSGTCLPAGPPGVTVASLSLLPCLQVPCEAQQGKQACGAPACPQRGTAPGTWSPVGVTGWRAECPWPPRGYRRYDHVSPQPVTGRLIAGREAAWSEGGRPVCGRGLEAGGWRPP